MAGRSTSTRASPTRTSNRVSAPNSGASPTVIGPCLRNMRSRAFKLRSVARLGPDAGNGSLELLEGKLNVLRRMRGGNGALLGSDGHKKYTQLIECAAQSDITLEVMMFQNVVEVDRDLGHQIVGEGRALTRDRCRNAVRRKDATQPCFHFLAEPLAVRIHRGSIRQ